ncbi:hypothetical protein [Nostoc sp. TCL240-02]|uniref:hypothetical protein n=1 Tax=Nostoc sp. TCL240-02 TaxID=2572090 RepID=UPI00157F870D|nr:hypothetical protein [Nostoc sp. TCL240-02]
MIEREILNAVSFCAIVNKMIETEGRWSDTCGNPKAIAFHNRKDLLQKFAS